MRRRRLEGVGALAAAVGKAVEKAVGRQDFIGRAAELDVLAAELELARSGRPRVVLLEGQQGIGKTSLVERLVARESGIQVLRAGGEQWEALVSYGVIDQLVRMAGASPASVLVPLLRSLPGEEQVGVGARLLELLVEREAEGPLVIVVDDAHWADTDSLRALLYALRRLVNERILTILGVRPDEAARLPEGLRRLADGVTGTTLRLGALDPGEVLRLAAALGVDGLSARVAQRLHAHTRGNPLYTRALLREVPEERWRNWQPELPAPRAFADRVVGQLAACSRPTRRLVEAAAVLGGRQPLSTAAALADLADPLPQLSEAGAVGLLRIRQEPGIRELSFPHPLVRAAVHEQLAPAVREELHVRAAALVQSPGAALQHRVAATTPPDAGLAGELERFAQAEAANEAWANAASALVNAARFSVAPADQERRMLRALDAMVGSGDILQATAFARDVAGFAPGPWRDAALGYLAILEGKPGEAEELLSGAWRSCDPAREPQLAATIAQRRALDAVGHLNGERVVEWATRAIELCPGGEPPRAEAEAVRGLALGWLGRVSEGLATARTAAAEAAADPTEVIPERVLMAHGWLRMVTDDLAGARSELSAVAARAERGAARIALWARCWLTRTDFLLGAWDESVEGGALALALLGETGHEWLRPLAHWAASTVPAARGQWDVAAGHVRAAAAHAGDYELSLVAAGLTAAQLASAKGDHQAVLRACEPLVAIRPRGALDEPGFWPWHSLYGDALVSVGQIAEADAFIRPHEASSEARARGSAIGRLSRVRGRIEAARGNLDAAEKAFRHGLDAVAPLPTPFDRALLELAYGQVLRRNGRRRAAAEQLGAAHERLTALGARPYVERAERELEACGLDVTKRPDVPAGRLTPQEVAVARLVARGLSNREVGAELFVSIKTVQFHLTRIYAKLGVSSRSELAARMGDGGAPGGPK